MRQALAIQGREFNFCPIQPTAVFGRVMDLKALAQLTRLGKRKDFVESSQRMRVQVIEYQDNLFGGDSHQDILI